MNSLSLFASLKGLLLLCAACSAVRQWDYETLSLTTTTSDESKLSIEGKAERMGRDGYAISLKLGMNYNMDDTTMVEATGFRSTSGSEDDYTPVPWRINKQTLPDFVTNYYADMIFKNLKHCSNLPDLGSGDAFPRGNYELDKCIIKGEGLPEILPEAYFKVVAKITGEVEWGFVVIVRIFKKTDLLG